MTEPQQEEQPVEDGSSLIPALLLVYATYLLYRGAHGSIAKSWRAVVTDLGLVDLAGGALSLLAARAVTRMRLDYGRSGDELMMKAARAAQAGVDAGLQMIAEALIWTDQQGSGDPTTKDMAGEDPTQVSGFVPTNEDPPDLLAQMVANAVRDATVLAAADLAGWVAKVWNSMHDDRVRDTHQVLDGQVRALGERFVSPSGAQLRFPHDPLAPIGEVANCFIGATPVEANDTMGVIRAPYRGPMVTVSTSAGRVLTGTPNHPILTAAGWIALGQLHPGSHLVSAGRQQLLGQPVVQPNVQNRPPMLEEVFGALHQMGERRRIARGAVNFYGDRPSGEVDVITADRVLGIGLDPAFAQHYTQANLVWASPAIRPSSNSRGTLSLGGFGVLGSTPGEVRSGSELLAMLEGHPLHPQSVGGGEISDMNASGQQPDADRTASNAETLGNALLGLPGEITLDDVVSVQFQSHVEAPVYTLSTVSGLYVAAGIVTHNCRCFLTVRRR